MIECPRCYDKNSDFAPFCKVCGHDLPSGLCHKTETTTENKEMENFTRNPDKVNAITFDELVEYRKANGGNIVNGMPWSFDYQGQPISHEDDECYIVATNRGSQVLTPRHVLCTDEEGKLFILEKDVFGSMYESNNKAEEQETTSPILQYFAYDHLPENLQFISKPIGDLAKKMDDTLPPGPEKSAGLRKLLEAKDCLVRANLNIVRP